MTDTLSPMLLDLGFPELTVENIEEHLPKIISTIEEDCSNPNFLQLLTVVFGQLASQFELDVLDSKLLKHILPPAKCTFENSLCEIKNMLEDSEEMDEEIAISISKALQACLDILSGYSELLEVLSRYTIEANHIGSLNHTLPLLLVEAFLHCKESETSYGSYFEESTSILTTFFRKSYEVQMKYYKLLEDKISFASQFEDDLNSLAHVLDSVVKITETVTSLDLKTCADQWRVYGKLYSKHSLDLRNILDVAHSLRLLSANIQQIASLVTSTQDASPDKQQLKLLKMGNFLLKIIIKLCELSDCNFRQGWNELLELLLLLFSCSKTNELKRTVKEDLRLICVGATPLLTVLLKENEFYKVYVELKGSHQDLATSSKVGLLFLTLSIMKNVVERKAPASWGSCPMIELVLDLFDSCGLLIDTNVPFEGRDAYSSAVSTCAAYMIATVDETSFSQLENELVSKLFQNKLHSAIFASDFLCLLGRLTSDQYCLHLTTYLCEALRNWTPLYCDCVELKMIGTTVRRLWALLSSSSRETLKSKFPSSHVQRWFDGFSAQHVADKYRHFCKNPSLSSYLSVLSSLPVKNRIAEEIRYPANEIVDSIIQALLFIKNVKERCAEEFPGSTKFLWISLECLSVTWSTPTPEQLLEILEIFRDLVNVDDKDYVQVMTIVFIFLQETAPSISQMDLNPQLIRAMAAIIIRLLEVNNDHVVFGTLEILKAFDKSPTHKEMILLVSSHSEKLVNMINSYFHRVPSEPAASYYSVITSMYVPEHACQERNTEEVDADKPPAKKIKMEADLRCAPLLSPTKVADVFSSIKRLNSEVAFLKNVHANHELSSDVKFQLNSIIQELSRLV